MAAAKVSQDQKLAALPHQLKETLPLLALAVDKQQLRAGLRLPISTIPANQDYQVDASGACRWSHCPVSHDLTDHDV